MSITSSTFCSSIPTRSRHCTFNIFTLAASLVIALFLSSTIILSTACSAMSHAQFLTLLIVFFSFVINYYIKNLKQSQVISFLSFFNSFFWCVFLYHIHIIYHNPMRKASTFLTFFDFFLKPGNDFRGASKCTALFPCVFYPFLLGFMWIWLSVKHGYQRFAIMFVCHVLSGVSGTTSVIPFIRLCPRIRI